MSGFIWPSSKTFEIVLIYKLYKYIYIYMKYHNSLYKHESISLFFGLYHTSWISCNFC